MEGGREGGRERKRERGREIERKRREFKNQEEVQRIMRGKMLVGLEKGRKDMWSVSC